MEIQETIAVKTVAKRRRKLAGYEVAGVGEQNTFVPQVTMENQERGRLVRVRQGVEFAGEPPALLRSKERGGRKCFALDRKLNGNRVQL